MVVFSRRGGGGGGGGRGEGRKRISSKQEKSVESEKARRWDADELGKGEKKHTHTRIKM